MFQESHSRHPVGRTEQTRNRDRGNSGNRPASGRNVGPQVTRALSASTALSDVRRIWQNAMMTVHKQFQLPNNFAARPNLGTLGQPVKILANHVKVDIKKSPIALQFDVDIERVRKGPRRGGASREEPQPMPNKERCSQIINKLAMTRKWPISRYVYDGQKLLYTIDEPFLNLETQEEFRVEMKDSPQEDNVSPSEAGGSGGSSGDAKVVQYIVKIQRTKGPPLDLKAILDEYYRPYLLAKDIRKSGRAPAPVADPPAPAISMEQVMPVLQTLDIGMRHSSTLDKRKKVIGNSIFWPEDKKFLRRTAELWTGLSKTLMLTQGGPHLVMDLKQTVVPVFVSLEQWMADMLGADVNDIRQRTLSSKELQKLNEEAAMQKLKVQVTHRAHGQQRFTLHGFTDKSARAASFDLQTGGSTTVEKYFETAYGVRLTHSQLPCALLSRPSRVPDSGSNAAASGSKKGGKGGKGSSSTGQWVPVEFCVLVPETNRQILAKEFSTEMLRASAVRPDMRVKMLRDLVKKADPENDPVAKAFGLEVKLRSQNQGLMEVPGRILPSPRLEYGNAEHVDPENRGAWEIGRATFFEPATINSLAIVSFMGKDRMSGGQEQRGPGVPPLMETFRNDLYKFCRERGLKMPLSAKDVPVQFAPNGARKLDVLQAAMQDAERVFKRPAELLVVVMEAESPAYDEVKRICQCQLGVQSQVVLAPTFGLDPRAQMKNLTARWGNLVQKINTKLGGINARITGGPDFWHPELPAAAGPSTSTAAPPPQPNTPAPLIPPPKGPLAIKGPVPPAMPAALMGPPSRPTSGLPSTSDLRSRLASPNYIARPGPLPVKCRIMLMGADVTHQISEEARDSEGGGSRRRSVAAVVASNDLSCTKYASRTMLQDGEIITSMQSATEDFIDIYRSKPENGGPPQAIIVYRDGVSDGEEQKVMEQEVEAIRKACVAKGIEANITFAVVRKRHGTRFFPIDSNSASKSGNVLPGLVVDDVICDPYVFDCYIVAHAGIQGTVKPAKYHWLVDENQLSADGAQLLTYWLSHIYARCTRTVSYCPAAYYAHLAAFAARSRLVLNSNRQWTLENVHPRLENTMFFV